MKLGENHGTRFGLKGLCTAFVHLSGAVVGVVRSLGCHLPEYIHKTQNTILESEVLCRDLATQFCHLTQGLSEF